MLKSVKELGNVIAAIPKHDYMKLFVDHYNQKYKTNQT